MRKVIVSKFEMQPTGKGRFITTRVDDYTGTFLGFGLEAGETGSYTVLIVEKDDGSIEMVQTGYVRFVRESIVAASLPEIDIVPVDAVEFPGFDKGIQ